MTLCTLLSVSEGIEYNGVADMWSLFFLIEQSK